MHSSGLTTHSAHRPVEINFSATINDKTYSMEVDVGEVVKKSLVSLALTFTNSILTMSVLAAKITGILVLPNPIIGAITKPLHAANIALAKHAFKPFQAWAGKLEGEFQLMHEVNKMVQIRKTKLIFYPQAWMLHAKESVKWALAPVSVVLSASITALWIACKPLYLALYFPGALADSLLYAPILLNQKISALTFKSLSNQANWMQEFQGKLASDAWDCSNIG